MPDHFLTWLDVERQLKRQTALWRKLPKGIHAVRCYADGMEVHHSVSETEVQTWLAQVFNRAWIAAQVGVELRIGAKIYPVEFVQADVRSFTTSQPLPVYPLWRDVGYLCDPTSEQTDNDMELSTRGLPSPWTQGPRLVSFHSFKGGVGRTTALMTFAAARLQLAASSPTQPFKVLVVDADLEAPGVTFWLDDSNRPEVSYLQFLEAMHYSTVSIEDSLEYFAKALRKSPISVDGVHRQLFVLPSAMQLEDIQDMPVQPSHLARNPSNPWILTDHLYALGQRLGVDVVLIDLRAGLSEFSSPILFDPRVEHYFVTTIAKQAVEGTVVALERLHAFNNQLPISQRSGAKPTVVLSLLTDTLRKLPDYTNAVSRLAAAYPAFDVLEQGIEWLEADFSDGLMSMTDFKQVLPLLKSSTRLYQQAQEWAKGIDASNPVVLKNGHLLREKAKNLEEFCRQMQFADTADSRQMLVIEPLRRMGQHFTDELPKLVSVGAKGAGKTFTFLQLCNAGSWHNFLEKIDIQAGAVPNATLFPVLWPEQLSTDADSLILNTRRIVLQQLGSDLQPFKASEIKRKIGDSLNMPPTHWLDFWEALFIEQLGMSGLSWDQANERLNSNGSNIILVIDGVEELFPEMSNDAARKAVEALLQLPKRLSELTNCCLGILVFVRADYVQAAIHQNVAQFLARYAPFQLYWSAESFLRLAYWLAGQANIFNLNEQPADSLGQDALLEKLVELWGRKLGKDSSKEALSARWVFASLCDLKGNVQARDLVRFLLYAARIESSRIGDSWQDRVISPESMRKAIPKCSEEKVDEAAKEIEPLRQWRDVLNEIIGARIIPFDAESVGLSQNLQKALQELGIIFEDKDVPDGQPRLYLPEIYRHGLGFVTSVAGRPRTQALLKSNAGLPF